MSSFNGLLSSESLGKSSMANGEAMSRNTVSRMLMKKSRRVLLVLCISSYLHSLGDSRP